MTWRPVALVLFAVLVLGGHGEVSAQEQTATERFEVASVRLVRSTGEEIHFKFDHGGIAARNVSLAFLIEASYEGIKGDDQILSAPKWLFSERFDVAAKPQVPDLDHLDPSLPAASQNQAVERTRRRLRLLLEDRFQLKAHIQTKEIKGYALVPAKQGAKFLASRLPDGSKMDGAVESGRGRLAGSTISMPLLATWLGRAVGAPVSNGTGLSGLYRVELTWAPDIDLPVPGEEISRTRADTAGPSIFTAVQEQLGLRLVPEKHEGVLLVIDRVEKPSAN